MKPTYKNKVITTSKLFILFLAINYTSNAQDLIVKNNGDVIESKVELIKTEEIKYKKYNNLNGASYIIATGNVAKIKFENGTIEEFKNSDNGSVASIKGTKKRIVKLINKYGFEEDTFKRRYQASFEGDHLRLIVTKKNSSEPANGGILYDFANVYKFHNVSKRKKGLAFVNIWVPLLKNVKKNKWDKHKLIMRVDGAPQAESILAALKLYNKLLTSEAEKTILDFK